MNYRALEDLIGILVKKAGYKLSDLKIEEDIDVLKDRKKYLEGEISTLKTKLDTYEYIDKDDRQKDEEEKENFLYYFMKFNSKRLFSFENVNKIESAKLITTFGNRII